MSVSRGTTQAPAERLWAQPEDIHARPIWWNGGAVLPPPVTKGLRGRRVVGHRGGELQTLRRLEKLTTQQPWELNPDPDHCPRCQHPASEPQSNWRRISSRWGPLLTISNLYP